MFLHHLHTQTSFVSDLLIRPAFTGEASHFLLARRESCEVRETRVSGWRPQLQWERASLRIERENPDA